MNINDHHSPQVYTVILDSLPFIIGAHTNQIPQLLTRMILYDIATLAKVETTIDNKMMNEMSFSFLA